MWRTSIWRFPRCVESGVPVPGCGRLVRAMAESGKGIPDFWEGIGYDFVRMASVMNLQTPWTPAQVNRRLASAQNMEWSMAP